MQRYPFETDGVITGDDSTVILDGEILIPESGPIKFVDGVDDFAYFAIDIDRSGTLGDSEDEVIINDNTWTNALSTANGGAAIVEVDFEGIGADGDVARATASRFNGKKLPAAYVNRKIQR